MLLDGYNWHHILKTLSPNEGCYMCLIQKIKQKYVDCNAIIKDGTFITVGGYALVDRLEIGNSVYIDISLRGRSKCPRKIGQSGPQKNQSWF